VAIVWDESRDREIVSQFVQENERLGLNRPADKAFHLEIILVCVSDANL
jgi:hypothetical protein